MTIINKSLLVTTFFFAASLSAFNEPVATTLQVIGGMCFMQGAATLNFGNKLIKNGYGDLKLERMPSIFKTPQNMRKFGFLSMPVGLAGMTSPIILEKAAELGKQHRKNKENNWKKKMASLDSLEKSQEDESNNS